ncbi:hypothetical protein H8N03_09800 [Ramlibacter sp. USB13]|uniref:STAS/SEC14 domain-containing protein n=1 Tax=Ramlibacter cellulosilyticus TaxID=2764187 RepID=A0A923SES3_9BURK|nr:hypothetical protein [Ramlibacter cellulosilyticus]MBC5783237.1 hypothetical protein [Ramlibacter cellulosilyticus]
MSFDIKVTHEPGLARVRIEGSAGIGRLLSLLKVLELDCRSWQAASVLLDLRDLQPALSDDEQLQAAEGAVLAFASRRKVALLATPGAAREAGGVRVFDDEGTARDWLLRP